VYVRSIYMCVYVRSIRVCVYVRCLRVCTYVRSLRESIGAIHHYCSIILIISIIVC